MAKRKPTKIVKNGGKYTKGHKKVGGRKKGVTNKVTSDVRFAVGEIVKNNADKVQGWLNRVGKTDPAKALDCYTKLLEYHIPKLQRTDLTSGGRPLPKTINVNIISGK